MTKTRNKLKIMGLVLTLVMMVSLLGLFSLTASAADGTGCVAADCNGTYANGFCSADGTHYEEPTLNNDGYYEIGNAGQLFWFAQKVNTDNTNFASAKAILTADIDANPGYVFNKDGSVTKNGSTVTEGWRAWTPIANLSDIKYTGHFNGNYHTISGLYTRTVTDLSVSPAIATSFMGYMEDASVLENLGILNSYFGCFKTETGQGHNSNSAGLVYRACAMSTERGSPTIRNCFSMANVYAYASASGIMFTIRKDSSVAHPAIIENCFFGGYAEGLDNNNLGSVAGCLANDSNSKITNCYYIAENLTVLQQNQKPIAGGATGVSAAQMANGYVAYHLGGMFGQNIDNGGTASAYPVFNGARVYRNGICSAPTYSNTDGLLTHDIMVQEDKFYDDNDLCLTCGAQRVSIITELTVGDVKVVENGEVKTASSSGWSYDHDTLTLTLEKGADIGAASDGYAINAVGDLNIAANGTVKINGVVYTKGRLNIQLIENATVTVKSNKDAIHATSDVTLSGKGTLTAEAINRSYSVYSEGDLTVDGITLNASSYGVDIKASSVTVGEAAAAAVNCLGINSNAMYVDNGLFIYNGSTVYAAFKTYDYVAATAFQVEKMVISDSTFIMEGQSGPESQYATKADSIKIYGSSHFAVRDISSTNGGNLYITLSSGQIAVEGSYYYRTDDTGSFVSPVSVPCEGVTCLELVTDSHLVYSYNDNFTHDAECADCSYKMKVKDDEACSWNYVKIDRTITQTCQHCSTKYSVTLNAPDELIYNESEKNAYLTGDVAAMGNPEIVYKQDDDVLASAPVNAGTYTAEVTVGTRTVTASFNVEKATPTASDFIISPKEVIYDGTGKRTSVTTSRIGMGNIDVLHYDADGNWLEPTNVGTYTVRINTWGGENYRDVYEFYVGTFTIECDHTFNTNTEYTDDKDGTHSLYCSLCKEKTINEEHSGGIASCTTLAVCEDCGASYGEVDTANHDSSVAFDSNGFCPNGCYQPAELEDGYYQIENAGNLFWFAQQVNIAGNTTANARLMADIDLENRTWYPIGVYQDAVDASGTTATIQYEGKFDGNFHTVSNFTAKGNGSQGLIGYTARSVEIKNLGVINATVSGWNAGAILAYFGTVENCYAINCTITGYTASNPGRVYAGAIAGSQMPTVKNCFAYNCRVLAGEGWESKSSIAPVGGMFISVYTSYFGKITSNVDFRTAETEGETEMTAAQFASGEVAYILNSNQTEQVWGQTLTGDNRQSYPVLGGTKVYYGYLSCADDAVKVYTNDSTASDTKPEHTGGEATCTEKAVCESCGANYGNIDENAHAWNEGFVTTNPTCMEKGVKTYTCTHNSAHTYTEDVAIDENAHAWNSGVVTTDPTCPAVGTKTFTCTHNSEHTKTEDVAIDENAHAWNEGVVTTNPTCMEKGVKTYTCKHNSAHTYTEDVAIDENAHAWNSGVVTTNPTCSAVGVKTFTCTHNSEHTKTEEVNAFGHAYDNVCDTTCNTCGEERTPADHVDEDENNTCDICGSEIPKDGLFGGAVVGIVIGSVLVVGIGGFALWWFVFRKKRII